MRHPPPTIHDVIAQLARYHRPKRGADALARVIIFFERRASYERGGYAVFTVVPETVAKNCDLEPHQVKLALKTLADIGLIKLLRRRHHKRTGKRIASQYDISALLDLVDELLGKVLLAHQLTLPKQKAKPRSERSAVTYEERAHLAWTDHQEYLADQVAAQGENRWGQPRYDVSDVRDDVHPVAQEARCEESEAGEDTSVVELEPPDLLLVVSMLARGYEQNRQDFSLVRRVERVAGRWAARRSPSARFEPGEAMLDWHCFCAWTSSLFDHKGKRVRHKPDLERLWRKVITARSAQRMAGLELTPLPACETGDEAHLRERRLQSLLGRALALRASAPRAC